MAALLTYDLARASTWLHVVSLAAVALGAGALYRSRAVDRRRNTRLRAQLKATAAEADERQRAVSDLFVNLARRNQSLLDRQLGLIGELEQKEQSPEALAELFKLDHLATRIRRNAESLLVLSGDEPARRWGRPVLLTEVVRAAAAEVEDYRRVDVLVADHLALAGRAVADLAHLLAELIENATTYSPSHRNVVVRSYPVSGHPGVVVAVEDTGIGMAEADMEAANRVLAEPLVLDLRGRTMGMHVVSRLARRYGVQVGLAPTPGGGLTALVTLPPGLVSERHSPTPRHTPRPLRLVPATPTAPAARRPSTAPRSTTHPSVPAPVPAATTLDDLGPAGAAALGAGRPGPSSQARDVEVAEAKSREHVRAMLSRFQASQRAGRALADAPAGSLAPARPRLVPREEDSCPTT